MFLILAYCALRHWVFMVNAQQSITMYGITIP